MGVVVPDPDVVPGWAEKEGLPTNIAELCTCQVSIQKQGNIT